MNTPPPSIISEDTLHELLGIFQSNMPHLFHRPEALAINQLARSERSNRLNLLIREAAFWNKDVIAFLKGCEREDDGYVSPKGIEWELAGLTHAFKQMSFSQAYHSNHKNNHTKIINTLVNEHWFIEAAQAWETLSLDEAQSFLQRVSDVRADIYSLGLERRKITEMRFMPSVSKQEDTFRAPAKHQYMQTARKNVTEFNTNSEKGFRNFLQTMIALEHEEIHGDEDELAVAIDNDEITPEHPLYEDALMLYGLIQHVEYTSRLKDAYLNHPREINAADKGQIFGFSLFHSIKKEHGIEIQIPYATTPLGPL